MLDVGITKVEVVAKGEDEVLKEEVFLTLEVGIRKDEVVCFAQSPCVMLEVPLFCRICNSTAFSKRIFNPLISHCKC